MINDIVTGSNMAFERLEPCAGKLACTVLRGVSSSNTACLLDFSFVGSQYHITVGKKDYFIDMLFYHLKLRSYVVIELKTKELEPRDVGQINFYLAAIDGQLKHASDNPSIGLLLCRSKGDKITAEYALRNVTTPIGIASYKLSTAVPKELADSLPSVEQIEGKLRLIEKDKNGSGAERIY